ncbi:hypothetical protein ACU8DI_05740 [Psychroserpens sp. BH13MA-6]
MIINKQHISLKVAFVILALTLLLPSVVKFSHVFSHHDHVVCLEKNQTHFHNLDLDCEFYKFKLQQQTTFPPVNYELSLAENNHKDLNPYYAFLSDYQSLHFSLRGPPYNS